MDSQNSNRFIWLNGEILPEEKANVSVYDSALMFGDMIFEMTRSFRRNHFKLSEHLERLNRSAKVLYYPKIDLGQIEKACHDLTLFNESAFEEDDEHRIMINISRGVLSIYEGVAGTVKGLNIIITDFPLKWTTRGMGRLYEEGINLVVTPQRAIPFNLLDPRIKSRSRQHLSVANIEASMYTGKDNWALLLDEHGYIAEGTGDNVFIVQDNKIITPRGNNILRGISRNYVKYLAHIMNYGYEEKDISLYDAMNADEMFITGTPFCILPVKTLSKVPMGYLVPGIVTSNLLGQWSKEVGVSIKNQIQNWDKGLPEQKGISPYAFS